MQKNYKIQLNGSKLEITNEKGEKTTTAELMKGKENAVIAFVGQMGAGKTTLIKEICLGLGVEDIVNSPTFAIVNVYTKKDNSQVYHFDCYRLKNLQEALDMGAEEYIYSGNLCLIEWPDVIEPILPENTIRFTIEEEKGYRKLTVEE